MAVVTAREIMQTGAAQHVQPDDSVVMAAQAMRDTTLQQVPVCLAGRLLGIVTQSDIVTRCVAEGRDPSTTLAGDLVRRTTATVDVGDSLEKALILMAEHHVRGLPVLDGDTFVGVLAQSDVTRSLTL
jgi:CBS domain-containing protein